MKTRDSSKKPQSKFSSGNPHQRKSSKTITQQKNGAAAVAAAAMITSSSRKQKHGLHRELVRRTSDRIRASRVLSQINTAGGEDSCQDLRLAFSSIDSPSGHNADESAGLTTIFSPVFHLFKGSNGDVSTTCTNSDDRHDDVTIDIQSEKENIADALGNDENRDPAQSPDRMEVDEGPGVALPLCTENPETRIDSAHGNHNAEDDGYDDFDPYLFIKRLPALSEVVSTSRCTALLPKQTRRSPPITLVLDLDETLVHSTLEHCDDADFTFPVTFNCQQYTVYVRCRPHLKMFMERVSQMFEIIVFTASQSVYAEQLLNILDPKRKLIRHRVFRDSCVLFEGNYLKDLTVLGRDLSKTAIVDNSPQAFGFQVDNGIPIESWFDDQNDRALAGLLPFLETLVGVDDVRPLIAKKFNLRQKIAAAVEPSFTTNQLGPMLLHM